MLEIGALRIDFARREVTLDGREVRLTPIEWKLLALLPRNAGKVVTHRQILREVWGPTPGHQTHTVRVHMAALRRKLEPDPARPRLLVSPASAAGCARSSGYSGSVSPEPPKSFGKSLNFGRPSRTASTFSP